MSSVPTTTEPTVDPRMDTCATCGQVTICHSHVTPDGDVEPMCGLDLIVWASEVESVGTRLVFRVEPRASDIL